MQLFEFFVLYLFRLVDSQNLWPLTPIIKATTVWDASLLLSCLQLL